MIYLLRIRMTPNAAYAYMIPADHQFMFWRTRREASFGRFRIIIHSMMDVARDKPYLQA